MTSAAVSAAVAMPDFSRLLVFMQSSPGSREPFYTVRFG
jgi:hypothetical protein